MTVVSFESVEIKELNEPLVDLDGYDFILEPMYFKQGLSSEKNMYLRKGVAEKLTAIQSKLGGYKFKIWDGYRLREVQNNIYQKFWHELKQKQPDWSDEKLAAEVSIFVTKPDNPKRIPPHATGGAVDLTLVDKSGHELNLGTNFDYFGPEAAVYYFDGKNGNKEISNNRKLLREALLSQGFRQDEEEWWHYDYGNQLWAAKLNKPFAIYGEVTK